MNTIDGVIAELEKLKKRAERLEKVGYPILPYTKITAASRTLTAGTSASGLADLQVAQDGLFYTLREAAATPGMDLMLEFTSVTEFRWVNIIGAYAGSATHAIAIQLRNWAGGAGSWHTFDAFQSEMFDITTANGYILNNHNFSVPDRTTYVGTGADLGKVQVRFYHTMGGNASHYLYIDVVALYR
jgi:hypothetical protein